MATLGNFDAQPYKVFVAVGPIEPWVAKILRAMQAHVLHKVVLRRKLPEALL